MSYIRGQYYTWQGDKMYMFGSSKGVPISIVDEFVVMRYARMTKKQIKEAEKRAIQKYQGNFGCDALCKKYKLPTVIEMVEMAKKDSKDSKKKKGGE